MDHSRRKLLKASLLLPLAALVPMSLLSSSVWADAEQASIQTLALAIHSDSGPHHVEVDVAETTAQRRRGLMEREHLPE